MFLDTTLEIWNSTDNNDETFPLNPKSPPVYKRVPTSINDPFRHVVIHLFDMQKHLTSLAHVGMPTPPFSSTTQGEFKNFY